MARKLYFRTKAERKAYILGRQHQSYACKGKRKKASISKRNKMRYKRKR